MSENFLALLKMEYTVVRAVFHFNELSVQSNQKPRRKTPEYWAFVLREYPELAEYFTGWAALPTRAWVQLLSEQPQFSEYCTHWAGFSQEDWRVLLRQQPELIRLCPCPDSPAVLSGLLGSGSLSPDEVDTTHFGLEDWFWAVKYNPDVWPSCPCQDAFTREMWWSMLNTMPQLAGECPFIKAFQDTEWKLLIHQHPELIILRNYPVPDQQTYSIG